jgi:hypothetical protein
MAQLIGIETTAHHYAGYCPVKLAVHSSGQIIVHFPLTDHADFPQNARSVGDEVAFECYASAHVSARVRTYRVPLIDWQKAQALPVPRPEPDAQVAALAALPADLETRLEIAARVAEDLFGGEWTTTRLPAASLPIVAELYREGDEPQMHLLAWLEGRLCIAIQRGRTVEADENLSAVFEDVAEQLFPEIVPTEEVALPVPPLDLPLLIDPASPELERCQILAIPALIGAA